MQHIKKISLLLLCAFISVQSMAWGLLGHRIVGEIADSYLTKKTKQEIFKILGTESIAMCSNWADFIKSDPTYSYLSSWHYINFKSGLTEKDFLITLDADTSIDAYTKINFLIAELKKKNLAQDKKVMYLRLLIHIAGDIHQPMHAGRLDDLGGNKVRVLWFKDTANLHQIWDDKLIGFQQLSYTEYATAINHTTAVQSAAWQKESIATWLYQSYQCAEKIYGEIKTPDQKLDFKYNFNNLDMLNTQLLKGGVHLAGLLNKIFGS
jgi:hypothetical protein